MSGHMRPLDPMETVVLGLLAGCAALLLLSLIWTIYEMWRDRQ